jgi:predicted dehydrogenase
LSAAGAIRKVADRGRFCNAQRAVRVEPAVALNAETRMSRRTRYAIVGTGARAAMYLDAIVGPYREAAELVALCDMSQTRMDWHNRRLAAATGLAPRAAYRADEFDTMVRDTRPDTVIVTTVDATHHGYIARAMELGCDAITEKPMTTDVEKMRVIFDAVHRTGRSLRVAFNYRYAPAHTALRRLMMDGVVGRPLCVDFSWLLDTRHGADYFRRWHREKESSGGLLVHKATHHFDLVNWWIDSRPREVFALASLSFYGRRNAAARGESYPYARYTGSREAEGDPFALFLDRSATLRGLYLEAEAESGYVRDRNVFGEPITIEDTMAVIARYENGALLSYCLVAYAPWEGLRVAITGDRGRVEMDIVENVTHLMADQERAMASKGAFKAARITVCPMFGQPYEVDVSHGEGGHGGADPVMLAQLFAAAEPVDPYGRAASHIDGAASLLVGFAANESMRTGTLVRTRDLFPLPAPGGLS